MTLLFNTPGTFKKDELDLYKRFLASNENISDKDQNLPLYWHRYTSNKSCEEIAKMIGTMFPGRVFVCIGYHDRTDYHIAVFKDDSYHIIFNHIQRLSNAVFAFNLFDPENDFYGDYQDDIPF